METGQETKLACKLCVIKEGIEARLVPGGPVIINEDGLFMTEDGLIAHLEGVHHIMIRRPGESNREARIRFLMAYPEVWGGKS